MATPPLDPVQPPAPPPAPPGPEAPRPGRALLWLKRLVLLTLLGAVCGALGLGGLVLYYDRDLPKFDTLTDYRPKQVTKVYCADNALCGEFFHERRTYLPKEEIPDLMKKAVISAEDANFYNHTGLDYPHIAHAIFKDVFHRGIKSGASTITQQVVKTFLLTPERSLARKIKEAILARRLEQNLSKDDILSLYLNQIYFGHHRYGIEEAAQYYFGKSARQLTLGEAAVLAGTPQSPNRINPITNPVAAKNRQTYVLGQMAKNGYITQAQADAEIKKPITLAPRKPVPPGPYYIEEVRKTLEATYGVDKLYEGGLAVQIAMEPDRQRAADEAVDKGLRELDKRQGYRGPLAKLPNSAPPKGAASAAPPSTDDEADSPEDDDNDTRPAEGGPAPTAPAQPAAPGERPVPPSLAALREAMRERLAKGIPREPGARAIWDLSRLTQDQADKGAAATWARVRVLEPNIRVGGVVAFVDDAKGTAEVDLGGATALLKMEDMKWARAFEPTKHTAKPSKPSDVVAPGDVVLLKLADLPKDPKALLPALLEQDPLVQGALVSLDPNTRRVVALVGGDDFAKSSFNRATQAKRQPGSSFKPYAYAAALASTKYTLASLLNDAPYLVRDQWTGKEWKPVNFEKDEFLGPISLRKALAISSNVVAVRVIEDIGPDAVIDMARRAGISSQIPQNLTIVLGTAEVSPLEHANAYATFAANGKKADPILILKVTDRAGNVLESHTAQLQESMPPGVAFLVTQMMKSVIEEGTAMKAQSLNRPAAGKTGTAQDQRDAWFCGYTTDLVTVTWVGFDNHDRMGGSETGAHAALPSWLYYMKPAMDGRPVLDFAPPPGVSQVRIDPKSGLLAPDASSGRLEYFLDGTQPKQAALPPDQAGNDFLIEDTGLGKKTP